MARAIMDGAIVLMAQNDIMYAGFVQHFSFLAHEYLSSPLVSVIRALLISTLYWIHWDIVLQLKVSRR